MLQSFALRSYYRNRRLEVLPRYVQMAFVRMILPVTKATLDSLAERKHDSLI